MVRSKMFSRSAWWSESRCPDPGVFRMSTSSPSSRKKPSSRATSKGRWWTAFILETRTFFSALAMGRASPFLGTHSILARAGKHTSARSRSQGGHHFPHEQIHLTHRLFRTQAPEGEDEQQVVDAGPAHHLRKLLGDRLRRAADVALGRLGRSRVDLQQVGPAMLAGEMHDVLGPDLEGRESG